MQKLDDSNFILYAAAHYDNPQCYDTDEFYDDLKRFKYLKRLFNRYKETGELKERLILNHLVLMNQMPEIVYGIGPENKNIKSVDLSMDSSIIKSLRKI